MKFFATIFVFLCLFPLSANSRNTLADLIVTNAEVRTLDDKKPRARSIAVSANKIIYVGSDSEIKKFTGPNTKIIDARGKLVIPGFNDAHVHMLGMGNLFSSIDLRGTVSPQELVRKLKYHTRFLPKGRWILGGGWNSERWTETGGPTRDLIDAETADNPVLIYSSDPNTALANSAAFEAAGIDESVRNPSGGEFVRDREGKTTGIIKGSAIYLIKRAAPASQGNDRAAVLETASNYAAAYGVTSVQDMSADDNYRILLELEARGKLKTRVYDCTGLSEWLKAGSLKYADTGDNGLVRRGCLKYFTEGDTQEESSGLSKKIASADKQGWQIMIHAIGGAANNVILNIFENVVKENRGRDRRLRVEHAHNVRAEDTARFAASKIIASMQPALFFGGVLNDSEPYRSLLESGAGIAFGSDSSMIPVNPFDGIYAAVMRKKTGSASKNQSLTVEEAVRLYTAGSAYAEFQEKVKGTITTGKYADFLILSDDIFAIPLEKISDTRVLMTVVNGKIVYEEK